MVTKANVKKMAKAKNVDGLIAALRDDDYIVRWKVAEALGEIGDARAVEPLIKALGDEDGDVRQAATEALGEIGDARAVEPLIKALGDEDGDVREFAVDALGKIGDARAVEPLIDALGDEKMTVRGGAAMALGKIGDARAVEPLIKALGDDDEYVRMVAAEVLKGLGDMLPEPAEASTVLATTPPDTEPAGETSTTPTLPSYFTTLHCQYYMMYTIAAAGGDISSKEIEKMGEVVLILSLRYCEQKNESVWIPVDGLGIVDITAQKVWRETQDFFMGLENDELRVKIFFMAAEHIADSCSDHDLGPIFHILLNLSLVDGITINREILSEVYKIWNLNFPAYLSYFERVM